MQDDDHQDLLYMPAEWSPHDACLILFPHNPQTFRLDMAQHQVLQVAHAIATQGQETVYLLVKDERQAAELRQRLMEDDTTSNNKSNSSSMPMMIHVHVCPSNDTWARDTGPTICFDRKRKSHRDQRIGLDWEFNAYGGPVEGCYWPCDVDQAIAKRICDDVLKIPCQKTKGFILEGGSIHTDGDGTLLVTKECLLKKNRNPQFSQEEIEDLLKTFLGVTTIIWLPHGLDADDDTNGHVDNFCCFVKPGHVVLAWTEDDVNDQENYSRCRVAESLLTSSKDARGRTIQVHRLLLPPPLAYTQQEADSLTTTAEGDYVIARQAGEKMAASYVNFYIANAAVIVPQFGVAETDALAIQTLETLFSPEERRVIGVPSREILMGGGNIHCITQQVPARHHRPLDNGVGLLDDAGANR